MDSISSSRKNWWASFSFQLVSVSAVWYNRQQDSEPLISRGFYKEQRHRPQHLADKFDVSSQTQTSRILTFAGSQGCGIAFHCAQLVFRAKLTKEEYMTPGIKPLVAGNWKMNGLAANLGELTSMAAAFTPQLQEKIDMLVCVPATLLFQASEIAKPTPVRIGAQDCHQNASGAHTGDISVAMIHDCGASSVIVGHSERRSDHGEHNAIVLGKAEAGLGEGMQTIVCIGETEAQRKAGETLGILKDQLVGSLPKTLDDSETSGELVIAYEPVWAIGSGMTPTATDVEKVHAFLRSELMSMYGQTGQTIRILYGGSVKPANAAELMAITNVDGALVGGASLKAEDFLGIAAAYLELV